MVLLTKLRAELKAAWKYWSVKFAALPATLIAFFVASPDELIKVASLIASLMPGGVAKWAIVLLIGVASWAVPTVLRMLKQPKLVQADGK